MMAQSLNSESGLSIPYQIFVPAIAQGVFTL